MSWWHWGCPWPGLVSHTGTRGRHSLVLTPTARLSKGIHSSSNPRTAAELSGVCQAHSPDNQEHRSRRVSWVSKGRGKPSVQQGSVRRSPLLVAAHSEGCRAEQGEQHSSQPDTFLHALSTWLPAPTKPHTLCSVSTAATSASAVYCTKATGFVFGRKIKSQHSVLPDLFQRNLHLNLSFFHRGRTHSHPAAPFT